MHEQLRTVGRLLDLSERAKPIECGVPLCDDCASGVLRELQRRLEEAHAEKQLLQAAFAEIEVGEEDDANEAPFTDESFAREVEAQEREEAELRTSLSAAKSEREELRKELKRLQVQRDEGEAQQEARFAALNAAELVLQERKEEAVRVAQLVTYCERELQRLERIQVRGEDREDREWGGTYPTTRRCTRRCTRVARALNDARPPLAGA